MRFNSGADYNMSRMVGREGKPESFPWSME